jgi:hypothetical protein
VVQIIYQLLLIPAGSGYCYCPFNGVGTSSATQVQQMLPV